MRNGLDPVAQSMSNAREIGLKYSPTPGSVDAYNVNRDVFHGFHRFFLPFFGTNEVERGRSQHLVNESRHVNAVALGIRFCVSRLEGRLRAEDIPPKLLHSRTKRVEDQVVHGVALGQWYRAEPFASLLRGAALLECRGAARGVSARALHKPILWDTVKGDRRGVVTKDDDRRWRPGAC